MSKKTSEKQQARQNKIKTIVKWVFCGLGWSILFAGFVSLLVVGVRGCTKQGAKSSQATAITTPVKPITPNNLVIGENEDSSQFEGFNPQSQETTDIVHFLRGDYSQELATGQRYTWSMTAEGESEGQLFPQLWSLTGAGTSAVKWIEFFNDPNTSVQLGATIQRPDQLSASWRLPAIKVTYVKAQFNARYSSLDATLNKPTWAQLRQACATRESMTGLTYTETTLDSVYALGLGGSLDYHFKDINGNEYTTNLGINSIAPLLVQTGQSSWQYTWTSFIDFKIETRPYTEDSIRYDRYQFSRKYGNYHELIPNITLYPYKGIIVNTYIEGGGKVYTGGVQHGYYYSMGDYLMESFARETIYYTNFDNELPSGSDNPGATGGDVGSGYENFFTLIAQAFRSIASVLGIYVLPGITLGTLIFIPLVASIVLFVVWLVKR